MKLLPAVLGLLLLLLVLNPNGVEARPAPTGGHEKKPSSATFFVFGDDFVDNGNLPLTDPVTEMSRQWAYPYGSNYVDADGFPRPNTPSGRFSNYQVQSDFIATMLGLEEAPPAHALTAEKTCDPSGMTFATGGASVLGSTSYEISTLVKQVETFKKMVKDGTITQKELSRSVALVAFSGNDYAGTNVIGLSSPNDINAYIGKVTNEIAANVDQLLKLGVTKVLVNNLHPIGCMPSHTRTNNYTACDIFGNLGASIHNNNLKQVMTSKKNVYIVDLYIAFTNIVDHAAGKGSEISKQFKRKLSPCCESLNLEGYCGQQGESSSELLYTMCDKSNKFFYWDDKHPTHAGWEAVMKQLEKPLREFVNQS
ncbi:GDSL esterase/lipase At5g03600-like [Hordeum vulgare subsp. vulgare]|uniref:GDSL esterase/lipase n=1 Tax=Hordeum vulgare subsp. vulgare TaxID=112509 RepID=A0A8I6Z6U4_HORVV|nr:GDSL esterase/lipase At5g03600-like [Hordeum vulgare subsp. vulgare]